MQKTPTMHEWEWISNNVKFSAFSAGGRQQEGTFPMSPLEKFGVDQQHNKGQ